MPFSDRGKLVAIAGAIAVCVLAGGWFAWKTFRKAAPPPTEIRNEAEEFLARVRNGDVDGAWAETTAEFKSFMGRDRLRQFVRSHPALRQPAEFVSFEMTSRNGLPLAEYCFQSSQPQTVIRVVMARESGTWRVERLDVEPTSNASIR